jgi:hypothetical protein
VEKKLWRIALIAALVAGLVAVVVFYRSGERAPFRGAKNVPQVVNNRIENMPPDKHLGDVVMWKKGRLVELPDKVYLVIPQGKNSKHNRTLGLQEESLITLQRGTDGKYYLDKKGILDKLGIFDAYVETYNGYWIFFKEKDAHHHLKKKRR